MQGERRQGGGSEPPARGRAVQLPTRRRSPGWWGGGTPLSDDYLQIKVGGDLALFQALGHLLLEAEERNPGPSVCDRPFLRCRANGRVRRLPSRRPHPGLDESERVTGLARAQIEKIAGMLVASKASIFCCMADRARVRFPSAGIPTTRFTQSVGWLHLLMGGLPPRLPCGGWLL